MVAHLGLRTYELLYEEIGNIIAELLSAGEKSECSWEVVHHSQRIFTLIQIFFFGFSYIFNVTHWKIEKLLFWI